MMNKSIYIASTYYHALISCIKMLVGGNKADIIITDYIPDGKALSDRIKNSGLFENVCFIAGIEEYKAKNRLDYLFNHHRKNAEMVKNQLSVDLRSYNEINIYHDDTWIARYLKDSGIKYRLIEDALDSYKIISETCFSYMLPKNKAKLFLKRMLGIGYVFCGYDKRTVEVEVNDINGVQIKELAGDKLVEVPRRPMFDSLDENDKRIISGIFMKDIPLFEPENSVLLLTQPLYADGVVGSEAEQIGMFKKMVDENVTDEKLVIKPHPRDFTDYSSVFPTAVIIDKNMPVEVLSFSLKGEFIDVLTTNSTSKNWINNYNK